MNREIRFRAYDTKGVYTTDGKPGMLDDITGKTYFDHVWHDDDFEKMQFCGLKDRNGKEIYEGDQLFAPGNLSDELQYVGDVVWDKDDARWEVHSFHGSFEYIPNTECVVKGNIYESKGEESA